MTVGLAGLAKEQRNLPATVQMGTGHETAESWDLPEARIDVMHRASCEWVSGRMCVNRRRNEENPQNSRGH